MATPPLLECERRTDPGADLAQDRQTFLAAAEATFARSEDTQEVLHYLTLAAVPLLADWCTVHLLEPEGGLRRAALIHRDPVKGSLGARLVGSDDIQPDGPHAVGRALASGKGILVADIAQPVYDANLGPNDQRVPVYVELGTVDSIAVPLLAGDERRGVLTVSLGDSGRRYSAPDVSLIEDLARLAGTALARVDGAPPASPRHVRRMRQHAALAALGQLALAGKPVEDLFKEAVHLVHGTLDARFAAVLEVVGDELRVRTSIDWPVDERGEVPPVSLVGTSAAALAARGHEPILVDSYPDDSRAITAALTEVGGREVASGLHVAIRHDGVTFGVLSCHAETPFAFSAEDVHFATAVSNVLGAAVARAEDESALRAERERLQLALRAGQMGDWKWDLATNELVWSRDLEVIFGLEPGTFGGTFDHYVSLIHPDDRDRTLAAIQQGLDSLGDHYVEHRVITSDGSVRWISGTGQVVVGPDGRPLGMIGIGTDITARKDAEVERQLLLEAERLARASAEKERDRLRFLAEASALLGNSLDLDTTLVRLAHLTVPRVADWCSIEMAGGAEPVVAHVDRSKVEMARQLRRRYPPDPDAPTGAPAVLRSGRPELYAEVSDEMLAAAAHDDEHLALLRDLDLRSAMVVPLTARGRVLGTITLVGAESGRQFDDDDLAFALDLARRAALAVDNAVLFQQRSEIAATLQRSLLPPTIPAVPHLAIATSYRHAAEDAAVEIGGDFYDVYEAADSSWHVCIGDACGKGTSAASLTGLARHTLRAVAMREHSPAEILGQLNEAMIGQIDDGQFCTIVYARIDSSPGRARITLANGGHPAPVIVRAAGSVERVEGFGTLVGAVSPAHYSDVEVELAAGDTLLLYTDGVTEARSGTELFGEDRLLRLLRSCAGMEPRALLAVIEAGIVEFAPGAPRDDRALMALQVRPPSAQ